jgi:hypothetical protein
VVAVPIPWPLSSAPGANPQESAGRLINCYAEPLGKDVEAKKGFAPPMVVWRKAPGLSLLGTSSLTGFRGQLLVGNTLYSAWSGRASSFTSGGLETLLTGTLPGSEKVFFARNNKTTPDVVCVAPGTGGFILTSSISSWSVAGAPNCVCFFDSYFILSYGDGTLQASDQNAVTLNTLNKTTAQSKPGGITRVVPFNGQLVALGPNFGEVYADTANPTGFPLTRSYVLQRGLIGPYALAGHEDGFGSALIWGADDNSIVMHNGTPNPLKISPPDLDRLIAGVADKSTLEASVYISQGHPKWVIKCPTFCWEFDLGSQKWNEKASYLSQTWRGIGGCNAFGKWVVGDTKGGRLLYIDQNAYTELTDPLVMQLDSGPVVNFPNRTKVARADFNFVVGVGQATGQDPIATNPHVGISWSNDGGITYGNEFSRELGRQSTQSRIVMLRTGMTGNEGRRWRLKISDPVYGGFLGGKQDSEIRNH